MSRRVLDLDRYVPALITFISNKLSAGASSVYRKKFGLGVTDWRIIAMLAVEPNITASRISQVIGLNKAAISRSLQSLERAGLVSAIPDRKNERRKLVALTKQGTQTHDKIIKLALARESLLLKTFSEEEINTLIILLQRMHKQIETVNAMEFSEKEEKEILDFPIERFENHTIETEEKNYSPPTNAD